MRLKKKNALVTGAAQGIGRSVCQRFAEEGAKVLVVDMNEEGGEETARLIRDAGGEALFHKADVSSLAEVEGALDASEAAHGPIHVMVNNAGIVRAAMLHKMSEAQWDEVIAVHLKGTWTGIHAAAKRMIPRKEGRIINVTSGAGLRGTIGQINYSSAKMGIVGATQSAARELGRYNITVNCVSPAAITPMTETIRTDERFESKYLERICLGRWGRARGDGGGLRLPGVGRGELRDRHRAPHRRRAGDVGGVSHPTVCNQRVGTGRELSSVAVIRRDSSKPTPPTPPCQGGIKRQYPSPSREALPLPVCRGDFFSSLG